MIPAYSYALFLPSIIHGLGFSSITAQLLSVPPNAAGFVVGMLFGVFSDRLRVRGPFVLAGALLSLVAYIILMCASGDPRIGYAGVMIAPCGLFPSLAIVLSWAGGNFGGEAKKAVVIAMVIGLGNLGG